MFFSSENVFFQVCREVAVFFLPERLHDFFVGPSGRVIFCLAQEVSFLFVDQDVA